MVAVQQSQAYAERAAALVPQLSARAAEHDRDASFPFEAFDALRAAGLLALTAPVEYGGEGAGLAAPCAVLGEVGRGDASAGLVLTMQYTYHGYMRAAGTWPRALHERLSRDAVECGALINAVRGEPELGTPSRGGLPATTATRVDGGWRLRGHKLYATGSPILAYYLVYARTAGDEPRTGYWAVPAAAPGVRIVETWDHMGMRATGSHDLVLEDVFVPDELTGDVRPPSAVPALDPALASWVTLPLAALYTGIARAARDWLVKYLNARVPSNLGASLATLPRFQIAVGEIEALLFTNQALIRGLADALDAGDASRASRAPLVKTIATNNAIRAVDIALGLVGNPGLSRTNPLERHHRDVLCGRIHVPQDDAVLQGSGRAALGV